MNDEIVIEIWPKQIRVWRCPVCGADVTRKTISIDERRKKCSKLLHKATPTMREYRLVATPPRREWAELGLAR